MATQFYAMGTGEWVGTRYFGGAGRGVCFDYGKRVERRAEVEEAARRGAFFIDEAGRPYTGEEFLVEVWQCKTTFGQFGGSFALGSGDLATWEGI